MGSIGNDNKKPHAVCIPYPGQGHITPMLKLSKLLHHKGFHITYVNTESNHRRLLKSWGPNSLDGLLDFRFETIPDGLPPPSDKDVTQDITSLCVSTSKNCLDPFHSLLNRLNSGVVTDIPPVTCVVSDGALMFPLDAAEQLGIPKVCFWICSAAGMLAMTQYPLLVQMGYLPLPDMSCVTNGYLETKLDLYPTKNMRLRDLPSVIRTNNPNDTLLNYGLDLRKAHKKANAIIFNTFEALEQESLKALSSICPPIYNIGPLQLMLNQIEDKTTTKSLNSSLFKEDRVCIEWLENKPPKSVVYVNFGSTTVMTSHQFLEFAWGLANSKKYFLWIIREDMIVGEKAILPSEFTTETKERGMLASWCPQEEVLEHPSIGGFLTHCGWNSILDTICGGVPVIGWPFSGEHPTNCRYCCVEWGMGMEIENNVRREDVEIVVRELMEGEKGEKMRKRAIEWKEKAEEAAAQGGSSYLDFNKVLKEVILAKSA